MTHQVVSTLCLWTSYDTNPLEDCQNKKLQIISIITLFWTDKKSNKDKNKLRCNNGKRDEYRFVNWKGI